jgi:DUF917 family protein
MDFSNIDPNLYGLVIAYVVIKQGMSLLEKIFTRKSVNDNSDTEIVKLVNSVREVMNQVVMALTTNNERLSSLVNQAERTHASTLQAVTLMAEGTDVMKEKVKDIQVRIDDIVRSRS